MAGLKQIMEIFMTINQPLSSEQRVRWYKQRIVPFSELVKPASQFLVRQLPALRALQ